MKGFKCDLNINQDLEEAVINLTKLSEVLRDLYNTCGNIKEVDEAFNSVYDIVKDYA